MKAAIAPCAIISALGCPTWYINAEGIITHSTENGPMLGRSLAPSGVPVPNERDCGGITKTRVRRDYARPFYYRAYLDGYLCIAYDGLKDLLAHEGMSMHTAICLCSELTDFVFELLESKEKPEVQWVMAMNDKSRFPALARRHLNLARSYPYMDYVETLRRIVKGIKDGYIISHKAADDMRVGREDIFDQYVQLIALNLLLQKHDSLLGFDVTVVLPDTMPQIALYADIKEAAIETVEHDLIWLRDEINFGQFANRFRFCMEGTRICCAISNAIPEPNLSFHAGRTYPLSSTLASFADALTMYAKAVVGIAYGPMR